MTNNNASKSIVYDGPQYVKYSNQTVDMMKMYSKKVVHDMHQESGLWDDLKKFAHDENHAVSIDHLDMLLYDFITYSKIDLGESNGSVYLGGTSVLLDRMIVNRDLPMTASLISYHTVDTAIMETMCSMNPEFPIFQRKHRFDKVHRAAEDVAESIEMYKHYMNKLGIV